MSTSSDKSESPIVALPIGVITVTEAGKRYFGGWTPMKVIRMCNRLGVYLYELDKVKHVSVRELTDRLYVLMRGPDGPRPADWGPSHVKALYETEGFRDKIREEIAQLPENAGDKSVSSPRKSSTLADMLGSPVAGEEPTIRSDGTIAQRPMNDRTSKEEIARATVGVRRAQALLDLLEAGLTDASLYTSERTREKLSIQRPSSADTPDAEAVTDDPDAGGAGSEDLTSDGGVRGGDGEPDDADLSTEAVGEPVSPSDSAPTGHRPPTMGRQQGLAGNAWMAGVHEDDDEPNLGDDDGTEEVD